MLYLCGTKYDLVEENKKLRKIDLSMTKEYSDGKHSSSLSVFVCAVLFILSALALPLLVLFCIYSFPWLLFDGWILDEQP